MRSRLLCLVFCLSSVFAVADTITLEELRLNKRFGAGISAAGPLSMLGMEFDVNVTEDFSLGGGIGTGLDYSTLMMRGRYFLLGRSVSPYIGLGVARWWTTTNTTETSVRPSMLANKFLSPTDDLRNGFDMFLAFPSLGIQFMHPIGLAVSAELEYFFKLFSLANGTYAGLAVHWYF